MRSLRKKWHEIGIAHHDKSGQIKTLLAGVRTDTPEFQKCQKVLDELLDDAHAAQEMMLRELWKIFKENPTKLALETVSQYWPEHPSEKETKSENYAPLDHAEIFADKNGEIVESEFKCPDCDAPLVAWNYFRVGKEKSFFLLRCPRFSEKGEKCSVSLKATKKEIKDGQIKFEVEKFKDKAIYGTIYSWFVTKDKSLNYPKVCQMFPKYKQKMGESVAKQTSKNLASFLTLFFEAREKSLSIHKRNEKTFAKNRDEKNAAFSKTLPTNWENTTEYNAFVSEYNIWANLENQQKSKDASKFEFLDRLKGVPSFPIVEKPKVEVATLGNVVAFCRKLLPDAREFWAKASRKNWEILVEKYGPQKVGDKVFPPKNARAGRMAIEISHFLGKNLSSTEIFEKLETYFFTRLETFSEHLEKTGRDDVGRFLDGAAFRDAIDTARTLGILLLEFLERKTEKYAEQKSKFDDLCGRAKGVSAFARKDRKTFEILGFSQNFQYSGAILFRENPSGNREWFLAFDGVSGERSPKTEKKSEPQFYGFDDKGATIPVIFDAAQKNAILIPIAFSTHQAQEFLWNADRSFLDGRMKINNARIVVEENENGKIYRIALAMQKLLKTEAAKKWEPKNWLGVDRGEVIPAAAVLVSEDGAEILEVTKLGHLAAEKQKSLGTEKSETQKRGKMVSGHRAKNISDGMLGEISREILRLATDGNAKIIFENLSRGFGMSRKRSLMSLQQYTKIADRLKEKIGYEGMDDRGWIFETIKDHTSQTCSKCGFVHAREFIWNGAHRFADFESEQELSDEITLGNGKIFVVPAKKEKSFFKDGHLQTEKISPKKWFADTLEKHKIGTKIREKELYKFFSWLLGCRPAQDFFKCASCRFEANADLQAALNIARMAIFQKSEDFEKYKKKKDKYEEVLKKLEEESKKLRKQNSDDLRSKEREISEFKSKKPSFPKAWMEFYQKMTLKKGWKPIPGVSEEGAEDAKDVKEKDKKEKEKSKRRQHREKLKESGRILVVSYEEKINRLEKRIKMLQQKGGKRSIKRLENIIKRKREIEKKKSNG